MSAWKSVKRASEVILDGIAVEIETRDNSPHAVTFTDAAGHSVRVALETYSMKVLVPEPPKKEKRFQVSGTAAGLVVKEDYPSEYEAQARVNELDEATRSGTALKVEPVEIDIPF